MDYNSTGYFVNTSYREQGTPLRGSCWMSSVRCGLYERGELKTIVAGLSTAQSSFISRAGSALLRLATNSSLLVGASDLTHTISYNPCQLLRKYTNPMKIKLPTK